MKTRLPVNRQFDLRSLLVAVLATALSFAAVLSSVGPELFDLRQPARPDQQIAMEHVDFVERLPLPTAPPVVAGTASSAAVEGRLPETTPAADTARRREAARVIIGPAAPAAAPSGNSVTAVPVPYAGRGKTTLLFIPKPIDPFAPPPPLTGYQRDSLLNLMRLAVPTTAANRVATREEQDSLWRAKSSPGTIPGRKAGEQGGFVLPGPWSGRYDPSKTDTGGGGVTFLSPGPSRAERKRDSVANSQFLASLSRLQARARVKQDSLRRRDSIARASVP
ncbi:MAG: hypothetical protein V4550_07325 [Gemmatimonadota bacterium]